MDIDCEHHQILLSIIQQIPELNQDLQPFLQTEKWSRDKRHLLINLLVQQLLKNDSLTSTFYEQIQRLFPKYFIAFIHRLSTAVNFSNKITNHISIKQRFLVLLAQILPDYPSLHTITEDHLLLTDTSLIEWKEESPKKKSKYKINPMNEDIYLLLATLRLLLLSNSKNHLIRSWKWNSLCYYLSNQDDEDIKWLAFLCLSIVFNMSSDQQDIYRPNVSNRTIFRIFELLHPKPSLRIASFSCDKLFFNDDFKKRTVFIGDIPLSKYNLDKKFDSILPSIQLTHTSTIEKCLREIALSVSLNWTTLIYSSISNGKTLIVEYIAEQIGKRLIKIQCSDHMDSKVLLGTYQCTDKPGEFLWTPGLLVEATSEGHWLLMEDIDAASSDVLSTIKSLIEMKTIGHGTISPDFRLFLTQRDTGVPVQSNELIHLLKSVFCVVIPSYSDSEIIQIMENLPIWNNDLQLFQLKLFRLYQSLQNTKGSIHTRLVTLRDLLKCCHRLSSLSISLSIHRQIAFHDVLDCFASFLMKANRLEHIHSVGTLFNMNNQEAEFFAMKSLPEFDEHDPQYFSIGHVKLEIQKKNSSIQQQYCFAKTRIAMFILERIARCVQMNEPVLLCGETGCGKTTLVQYLAQKTGNRLHVINLSQQSDAVDLLGGYKPFDSLLLLKQIYRDFTIEQTTNDYIDEIQKSIQSKRYKEAIKSMIKYTDKTSPLRNQLIKLRDSFKLKSKSALIFRFLEGSLVQALRNGDWILLDEINLASSETLQLLSGILESEYGTIWLAERGDKQPIVRHKNFRLFGCMNPASDVGKRDIPIGIRNRFTELYVDECDDRSEYTIIVDKYLNQTSIPKEYIDRIVTFYIDIQMKVKNFFLTSSSTSNNRIAVTYSLRTLCRALRYVATTNWSGKSYTRALFEGFCLSFFSQLDRSYYHDVQKLIHQIILQDKTSIVSLVKTTQMVLSHDNAKKYIEIHKYFILKGDQTLHRNENYIFTPTVTENLINIIRVLSAKSYPVLLQGETSVGKTSLIHWLASTTGNKCLRINNHEHTDLSEYLGTYTCSSTTGQLIFQDGPLIKAMRFGWWIILDELNLASSDILEALNRLLDDNRQLYLSETNELINAHERFQLFATQNPAGEQYAGRKRLSRAFRNRFIELHFDNLPQNELEIIIEKKCQLPKSYSKLLIQTMIDLQKYRSQKGIFSGKSSLITLRDLFRWAQRYTKYENKCENYKQFLAEHGYLLLAGRARNLEDRNFIKNIIEKHFCEKTMNIDEDILFGEEGSSFSTSEIWKTIQNNNHLKHIVWTQPLRRLAILCALCVQFDEPALLVGETGCGKTTICEILSKINGQKLYTVNCHTTTESADFLGSIRPVRRHEQNSKSDENQGLFEWQDGALVCSMKDGGLFLIDEISLADDSVLERLNSVLEPEKELVLAEKGYNNDDQHIDIIKAHEKFRLVATMNPGGDFGKKELSPALRNRFTEIWCTPSESIEDFSSIIVHNLTLNEKIHREQCAKLMCDFIQYLRTIQTTKRILITVRDLLSWISFINLNPNHWHFSYEHGAYLVFIDAMDSSSVLKQQTMEFLTNQQKENSIVSEQTQFNENHLTFGSYSIPRGPIVYNEKESYSFKAPTTLANIQRLLRAMQLTNKPILIEGSPGVGKTSLVIALAQLAGYSYIRINLSEQTDISDLFGSDLPDVESGQAGKFKWHDGPLLTAIKNNQWIILDELNLANQSVLEGLNACLDHRGEIYIPELNRTFYIHDKQSSVPLRIFACQNPYGQVSGRKGLPKSFINRFTTIYFSVLERIDLKIICQQLYEEIREEILDKMLNFNEKLQEEFNSNQWDFNLRDLLKWCQMFNEENSKAFDLIYVKRMRTTKDREKIQEIYQQTTGWNIQPIEIDFKMTSKILQIGSTQWSRESIRLPTLSLTHPLLLLRHQLSNLSSIFECLSLSWPILLVGPSSRSSKSTLIHLLSCLCGHQCHTFELNSAIDTNELLGNYEQFNFQQYAKYHLDLLKHEYFQKNQRNLSNEINYENQLITIEYLNELKEYFPSDEIEKLISKYSQEQHFVWIESILIRSMKQGDWLILESVNQCSLSVLDRLNSLLEPNGQLILNEGGGQGSVIKPHKNFRLILTMDPKQGNGEISRAMRNRCCEIYIDDQQNENIYDMKELIQSCQIYQDKQQEDFRQIHRILSQKVSTFAYHNLIRACLLYNELSHSSTDPFRISIKTAYRTLNSRLNAELDLLIDEFISISSSSNFLISPIQINNLCLQPELTLSYKRNLPLWNSSNDFNQRKFHLVFYRFIENLSNPSIINLYIEKWLNQTSSKSLFHYYNIRTSNVPFGLYDKIHQQIQFWSKFLWFNGSFLQSDRSTLETFVRNCLKNPLTNQENLCLQLIEQSFNEIDLIQPRGEIDPKIYEQILHDYKIKFQSEISFEYDLRREYQEQYEYSIHCSIHQWENEMKIILNEIPIEQNEFYRFNNDQYQILIVYLTKQLINELLNKKFLLEEIYEKNQKKIYQQWRKNIVEFYRNFILAEKFYIYRDVTMPLMKQVFQIVLAFDYQFQWKNEEKNQLFKFCRLPLDLNQINLFDIAKDLFEKRTFVQQTMPNERFKQYFVLILEYLVVYSHTVDKLSEEFKRLLQTYLETIYYLWSEEQRQIDEEKRLSSSIYRHETSELESEQDHTEYHRLFPSFDSHFQDFLPPEESLPIEETKSLEDKPSKSSILPYYLLFEYFSSIFKSKKPSLNNLLLPFFNTIYEFGEDDRLITHMIRFSVPSKDSLSTYFLNLNKPFDIYQDSKSSMIIECYPTIASIEQRTNYLLLTHDNHPTLTEILLVIQRIKSFSISHSLIKFLYGFDILFTKLTYWQQTYASKSLQTTFDQQLELLTTLIIRFRKYEFSCYEQSLSMIDYNQRQTTITTWWLHLFNLINSKQENVDEFEKVLHEFFRQSTLGDFPIRLEICQIFLKYFPNENRMILNSIIQYYQQFQDFLDHQRTSFRKPIEIEIKKFLSIQQWKDTNYYSLKQSIEKSHQFLFKSMKKYKQFLHQPIEKHLSTYQISVQLTNEDFFRLIKLKFNKKIFHLQNFSFINEMKYDTKVILELSSTISAMKIETNDRKELKQLYTEKRQLITQLFQKLTSIGLSYRKGLMNLRSQTSYAIQPIEISFLPIDFQGNYGLIETKKKKLILKDRSEVFERFEKLFIQTDLNYYRILYQHKQLDILSKVNKLDPIIYQRIQGFQEHLIKVIFQQKFLLHSFLEQYEMFTKHFTLYSKRNFQFQFNQMNHIDRLYHSTIDLIERVYSFLLIIRAIPKNSMEEIPILDIKPNYVELVNSNDLTELLEKFLERLKILLEKMNGFYENVIDYHPSLKDIYNLQQEICLSKELIGNVMGKLFIDENRFPNDHFIGDLTKNFMEIYTQFSKINILKHEKDSIPSVNPKPLRRYTKRLISALDELSSQTTSSPMWLVHFYNYLNGHITRFDLPSLTKLISKSLTSKSILFFNQIHLLIEQLLYRFIYYHHCTSQVYLSLSNTFITLLRDGFQMPPEESEDNKNSDEQKAEGGLSGMGDGQVGKDAKDVSDQIETEDQLDEAKMPGQEQEKTDEQENVSDEKNGMEVSFDFEANMDDPSKNEDEEGDENENENESNDDDDNIEDQMGDVDEDDQGEVFDDKKWGDEDKEEDEEEEEKEKKPNESEKATGKDKKQRDGLSAKDDQLDLNDETIEENPEPNNDYEDQPPGTTDDDDINVDQLPLELPDNMELDGNDKEEEAKEENSDELEHPDDENMELPDQEEKKEEEEEETIGDENEKINSTRNPIPDDLPDQDQAELEQSALTQDKTSNNDTNNQPNEHQQSFANAETFEEEKQNQDRQQEHLGESSSTKTSQTQQMSSNQQNQLTQQLNPDRQSETNPNQPSNQSNEQRTLSEIASLIDQNIKAAFDLEQNEQIEDIPMDDIPTIDQSNQSTQIYAHAKNIPKDFSQQKQILDSATDQQVKHVDEENQQEPTEPEPMMIDNQQQEEKVEEEQKRSTLKKEPITKSKSSSSNQNQPSGVQAEDENEMISIDKPYIPTETVEHQFDYEVHVKQLTTNLTEQIEYQLEEWYTNPHEDSSEEQNAEQLWTHLEYLTQPYVFELCEQLRLLLEPTQRTKYSGDYRTGKRLNMKRIISYIASDFRKDRIWLRRLKPSKRQYQLILAIDDSQSMDNLQVKRLALESLILLGQTLNLLDIGQFGIVSFGQYIRMLQPLNQTFNHENGIEILKQLKFDQTKTLLAELMESVTSTFSKEKLQISNPLSQLLIILSDGRGLTVSGKERLLKSVRHAISQNIFVVFVILDNINHEKSTSIFQINEAIFNGDKVEFRSYLDSFPFPYYLVIQNLEMLPRALIDVMRQFLELTTTNNNNNQ
ncbi:hypothetical protein I4U23_021588 [Adineta vaga]|nr:hypothetical protein I4U23_021588 [Adineta vaga]